MKRNQDRVHRKSNVARRALQTKIPNTKPRWLPAPANGVWFTIREAETGKFLLRLKLCNPLVTNLHRVAQKRDQSLSDIICDAIDIELHFGSAAPKWEGRAIA